MTDVVLARVDSGASPPSGVGRPGRRTEEGRLGVEDHQEKPQKEGRSSAPKDDRGWDTESAAREPESESLTRPSTRSQK